MPKWKVNTCRTYVKHATTEVWAETKADAERQGLEVADYSSGSLNSDGTPDDVIECVEIEEVSA